MAQRVFFALCGRGLGFRKGFLFLGFGGALPKLEILKSAQGMHSASRRPAPIGPRLACPSCASAKRP